MTHILGEQKVEILPDSRLSTVFTPKAAVMGPMGWMVPIFCGSCGCEGGLVPQENMTFAFWLCNDCFARHGEITNTMAMPDEIFWEEVKHAQLDKYGRNLGPEETLISLSNPDSLESRLARDRSALTPASTH